MIKKSIVYAMVLSMLLGIFTSCKQKEKPVSSSLSSELVSSSVASSEQSESDKHSGWGEPESPVKMLRPSFISAGANGDIFYCSDEGSIYRQLSDGKGLSKVYSSSGYDFVSVEVLSDSLICAGYTSSRQESGYIIFDLKEKTVSSAVWGDEFKGKSIYSLIHFGDSVYFLANPDRYGRYTLYRQTKDKTQQLASGVNEFFILRGRVFYNIGGYIFSINADGSDLQIISEVVTHDFSGFTITKDSLFYMSSENTYHTQMQSSGYRKYSERIKVYTSTESADHTFFCGAQGGIYAYSFINDEFLKVSTYTAAEIVCIGDYLYLSPAKPEDYPEIPKEYIVGNSVHRFKISDLIGAAPEQNEEMSSSLSSDEVSSDLVSSSMSQNEVVVPVPEKFGM